MSAKFTTTRQNQATPFFPERNWRLMLGNTSSQDRPAPAKKSSFAAFPAQPDAPKGWRQYLRFHR